MILAGLKLMAIGMTTVMLFLVFMILSIEWVKYLNRNFTLLEKKIFEEKRQPEYKNKISKPKKVLPIEVFAAAISAFESDKKTINF